MSLKQFNKLAEATGRPPIRGEVAADESFLYCVKIAVPPSVNHYLRRTANGVVKTEAAKAYQKELATTAKRADWRMVEGKVSIIIRLCAPASAIDCDNCLKLTLDALIGICYLDDSQVYKLEVERDDEDGTNGRCIWITASRYERGIS